MDPLLEAIRQEAHKLIRRQEAHARRTAEENARRRARSSATVQLGTATRPEYWTVAPGFDPYLVRARATSIAHSMHRSIALERYEPRAPTAFSVPKAGGGFRTVSVLQVADSALSKLTYQRLIAKNAPKLSQRAYAYRPDLGAFDAIQYLQSEFAAYHRLFIAEFDFSQYFDQINHDHVWRVLRDGRFLLTKQERHLLQAFLSLPVASVREDGAIELATRVRGIAQGTSVSLFLANVAAVPLDRQLERLGVGFARYADDTLIFSPDYSAICRAVELLHAQGDAMGVSINSKKSPGISVLIPRDADAAEMRHTYGVDYLGHRLSGTTVGIKQQVQERVQRRISRLLYDNLLREPLRGAQEPTRLGKVDRDYARYIWQLRRYLYGNLSEQQVRRYLRNEPPARRFIGFMSFFPLVDDLGCLVGLDDWVEQQTWRVMRKRAALLTSAGLATPPPHGLSPSGLRGFTRKSQSTGGTLDLRLPSFRRIAEVMNAASAAHGPNAVGSGGTFHYYN